jgi:hypothetical protein
MKGCIYEVHDYELSFISNNNKVRFPALPEKKVVGLERGPLNLVSTAEDLFDRKVEAAV